MPCIQASVVTYLFETLGDHDAAIPCWNYDMIEPLHAVYRRSVLMGYLESHDSLSLRPLIRSINTKYVPVEELKQFDPELRTFININKVEDLERINSGIPEKNEPSMHPETVRDRVAGKTGR